jgi:CMP-N-acetylneuraminic acid synthetase
MKVVAYVPLKLQNQRLPGKNLKRFRNGRPLLSYILQTLAGTPDVDEKYVYCSDASVGEYLPEGVTYLTRSTALDQDTTKINEVMQSFANTVPADIYVLVHATAPFISSASIAKGVAAVKSGQHDSALAVQRMQEFLWQDGKPYNYDPAAVPRTQDLKPFFVETTGLYVYTRKLILEESRRIGRTPYLIEVSKIEATDVNEPVDFEIADALSHLT